MEFEDIEYEERMGRYGPYFGLYMPGRYWVGKKYIEAAWIQVNQGLPLPGCRDKHTARMMCGDEFWLKYEFPEQLKLGRCVKFYVVNEMLPLRLANKGKGGSRQYIRI